ncbi:hypothetical protein J6590_006954 [Homalodisca vitripennis]|nr:hypothetical protein J6590_006954 [Homalodisca vitripennis]
MVSDASDSIVSGPMRLMIHKEQCRCCIEEQVVSAPYFFPPPALASTNFTGQAGERKRSLPRSESPRLPPDGRYPILRPCVPYKHTTTAVQGE